MTIYVNKSGAAKRAEEDPSYEMGTKPPLSIALVGKDGTRCELGCLWFNTDRETGEQDQSTPFTGKLVR